MILLFKKNIKISFLLKVGKIKDDFNVTNYKH